MVLLNSWFDEIFFYEEKLFIFPQHFDSVQLYSHLKNISWKQSRSTDSVDFTNFFLKFAKICSYSVYSV